jgi:predicted enzyme related to lactoylglutathione lyase
MQTLIQSLGQIAITVKSIEQAKHFYGVVLGLPHLFDAGPQLSFYQCGEVRLMLSLPQAKEEDTHNSVLYYKVANLEQVWAHFELHQVHIEQAPHMIANMPDHELWMGFIRDTEQNLIGLMEERAFA